MMMLGSFSSSPSFDLKETECWEEGDLPEVVKLQGGCTESTMAATPLHPALLPMERPSAPGRAQVVAGKAGFSPWSPAGDDVRGLGQANEYVGLPGHSAGFRGHPGPKAGSVREGNAGKWHPSFPRARNEQRIHVVSATARPPLRMKPAREAEGRGGTSRTPRPQL